MKREILYKFFNGEISDKEETALKKWIEASEDNYFIFLRERKIYDALLVNDLIPIRTQRKEEEKKIQIGKILIKVFKVASIVLITVLISWYFIQPNEKESEVQTVRVPAGQRTNLTLPDSTVVWLNALTRMEYKSPFNSNKREVFIDGEAYFEVKKNEKPFIVKSPKGSVEVFGTKFNIEDYSTHDIYEATLMEGSIKISANGDLIDLIPGYKTSLINGKLETKSIDDYDPYRWRDGLICFKNESFRNIMGEFEKYYGIKIILNNMKVREKSYTGKFRQSDGVDYALRVLQKDIYFDYERNEEENIIIIS